MSIIFTAIFGIYLGFMLTTAIGLLVIWPLALARGAALCVRRMAGM